MFFDVLPYFKTGLVIAILNALAIINSSRYFLATAKFSVIAWLAFNVCAPSVALYLVGFITGSRVILAASLPFLLFFGGGGMLVFTWKGFAAISQVGHTLMIIASAYILAVIITEKAWSAGIPGVITGLILFAIIFPIQNNYVKKHPDLFTKAGGAGAGKADKQE